ncbi:MAG: endolytic transglycosylase MltG [Oscillospiraceae bacterium]|nr:endolytic transglycosylase MltG [Oscillospiraceae bacterium]
MRGISLRNVLLGFGLGLVCASIVFLLLFSNDGDTKNSSQDVGGSVGAALGSVSSVDASGGIRLPLREERVILLDGNAPRQISNSEIIFIEDEMLALANEIAAAAEVAAATDVTPTRSTPDEDATTVTTASTSTQTTAPTTTPTTTTTTAPTTISTAASSTTTTTASTTTSTIASTTTTTAATTTTASATTTSQTTTTPTTTAPTTTTPTTTAPTTTSTLSSTTTTAIATTAAPGEVATLTIVRGDTATSVANKLYNLGLIQSTNEFIARLGELGLTGEILDGTFQLPYNLELDDLIDRIRVHK